MAKQSTHEPLKYIDTASRLSEPMTQHVVAGTPASLGESTVDEQMIVAQPGFYENVTKKVRFYEGDPLAVGEFKKD